MMPQDWLLPSKLNELFSIGMEKSEGVCQNIYFQLLTWMIFKHPYQNIFVFPSIPWNNTDISNH